MDGGCIQRVPCRGGGAGAGSEVRIKIGSSVPAFSNVCRLRTERILGGLISFGVSSSEIDHAVESFPEFIRGGNQCDDLFLVNLRLFLSIINDLDSNGPFSRGFRSPERSGVDRA